MASPAPNTRSELAELLIEAGLDMEYWAGVLKTKLDITLPQQIQYLDETHLKVLKDAIRHEWEEKALRNLFGITSESTSNQASNDKSKIVAKLTDAALDGEYWADIIKKKLGITRMEQVVNIKIDDLEKLKDAIRHDWEANALRKFFGISEEAYQAFLAKLQKQRKQTLEDTKNLLDDVVKMRQKGLRPTDDVMNSTLDQLRKSMNVAKEQWVEKYDEGSLDNMISTINSDLKTLDKLAESRPVTTAPELIANASAGLALRGILVGKAFSDDCLKRTVLSKPTDVQLKNTSLSQVDDVVHFSSKAQSEHFHRSLDTMGYSVAATVKGRGWGLGGRIEGEAGFSTKYETEDEKESASHKHTHFESRVKYSVIPTAACELNPYSLKLSQQALQELKTIDRILLGSENQELACKKCEKFLMSYGSHINAGVLHFGGLNRFVATYTSEAKSKSDKTKSMLRDALNVYASASYSNVGFNVGGSVSADHMKTHGSFKADYKKSEQAKISLHTTRKGGPQEVSALPLWKMGLVTNTSTWALIDRGKTFSSDFIGIWKLIPNHKGDFRKPVELASCLMTVWEKISGYHGSTDQGQTLLEGLDAIDMLMGKISTWNSDPVLPEMCVEYLQEVLKTVEYVETLTGTNKYWEDKICTEVDIGSFLVKVVELKDQFDCNTASMIQFLIRRLVKPAGFREFPGKQTIMKWSDGISETVDISSILTNAGVKGIPDLIRNVKDRFLPTLQKKHAKNTKGNVQTSDSINAGATVDLALCVGQLLKHLQSSGELHKMFFLNVSLLSLHYHWSTSRFKILLTIEKIQHFVQCIKVEWKKFLVHEEKGIIQHEAFLIHTLLTSDEGKELLEDEFSEIIKDLRQVLSPQLNNVLNRYATKSPFNWVEMTSVTGELAEGNMSVAEEREVDISDLQEIFASHNRKTQQEGPSKICKPGVAAQGEYLDTLKTLGLDEYYPSKISLLDAMVIRNVPEHPKLVDLPWMIIHRLLMIDFHARDQLWSVMEESEGGEISDGGDDFGLDNFLLETQSTCDDEDKETQLSTLDVLVATFTCCDNFLKQTLTQKLFVCKLAIPFLYPLGSEGNVLMSLWALRTITVQWHTKYREAIETPVTEKPFPLVTFVRLGRPPMSKSKLMNDILWDDSHDTFFNHDCNNGDIARRLTDGLVECSWFITAGNEKEHLPRTTMFLNLRGDASLMEKQMQILQEISSVVFVIVTAQDLARTPNTSTCQRILRSDAKVILFIISGNNKQENRACVDAVGKDLLKEVHIISSSNGQGTQKNVSKLKIEARKKLSKAIASCSGKVMEECVRLAKKEGIIIDEHEDESCLEGKVLAENVLGHMKGHQIVELKSLLPLQGAEWIEYCKLQKKRHRTRGKGSQSSSAYQADQLKQKMNRHRENQVKLCQNSLTPFIKDFMSSLPKKPDVVLYFLKWVTIFLDEILRATLPSLRRQYHTQWTQFQVAKKNQEKTKMKSLESQVDDAENQLASASLGLENFFRELGQIYEAVKGSSKIGKDTRTVVEYLPDIAAKLLMNGSPLEFIDGDSSSVPIEWVKAVLSKLGDIIGNKRLFVLSVLGIQSSGKSTLLNTMFGLQFTVSAGRCTRGAYMQLIPVDDHAKLRFDYIVVLDTEGLRAPELGQLKYEHDNELATLVIGLGDVTMVNIKGENTAEIKDILQIAVHAFLRMNIVTKHISDHRTCIFVHQNVPAANAEELVMHGCQKLQECLDDMAKEAANSENIANIHSFSQIINFDIQKHVWYFPDLWHGNPPMAPANPVYSKKAGSVKLSILGEIAKEQTTFLTTSDLSIRLADLWNGVLADDFVFSFRNSLEVKAFNSLQSRYYTLEWELQNDMKSWLNDAEIKLEICETVSDLENSFQSLDVDILKVLTEKAGKIKTRLIDYFEKSNLQEIIIQWQQSKLHQLHLVVEQQQNEAKTNLLSIKEARRMEILQVDKWSEREVHIMNKATTLAYKLKDKEGTGADLKCEFDTMWVPMVNDLATKSEDKELKIDLLMEHILQDRFHAHRSLLRDELERHPLQKSLSQTYPSLEDSITVDDVKKEHISLKTILGKMTKVFDVNNQELEARHKTVVLAGKILQEINTYLIDVSNRGRKFQNAHATEVIQKIMEKFETYNQNDKLTFTILPSFVVKLAVHVSRHCVQVFSRMQSEYNRNHGVKVKLDNYKNTAWSLFKNIVKQRTEEVIAGDIFCTQLEIIIKEAVKKDIPRKCVNEVIEDFSYSKNELIVKIMADLAHKENFKDYESYIKNAKKFALSWITQYTNEKMFSRKDGSDMSRYAKLTTSHVGRIIRCIAESVEHATSEVIANNVEHATGEAMSLWIYKFCHRVSEGNKSTSQNFKASECSIAVPISTLHQVRARQVVDFSNLQRIILTQLDKSVEANLVKDFKEETKENVKWHGKSPPQHILDELWGCPEQCPFCNEPCAIRTADHYLSLGKCHMCVQHRPTGIAGSRWRKDSDQYGVRICKDQLAHETCNYFVQWKRRRFKCKVCHFKCRVYGKCSTAGNDCVYHYYREYKTYLPEWDIAPDSTNSVSKYWMWFMATYQSQLKDMYGAKLPDIPESWKSITKTEAVTDLHKIHN